MAQQFRRRALVKPPGGLHLVLAQVELSVLHPAHESDHQVVVLRVIPAAQAADILHLQPGFLTDFTDCGLLGGFLLPDESGNADVVLRRVGLAYQRVLSLAVSQQAYHAGVGKAEPRSVAILAERYLALVAHGSSDKLRAALRAESEFHTITSVVFFPENPREYKNPP